jgi:hypothetical protein
MAKTLGYVSTWNFSAFWQQNIDASSDAWKFEFMNCTCRKIAISMTWIAENVKWLEFSLISGNYIPEPACDGI